VLDGQGTLRCAAGSTVCSGHTTVTMNQLISEELVRRAHDRAREAYRVFLDEPEPDDLSEVDKVRYKWLKDRYRDILARDEANGNP
jgi:hypothetical protein